jgi:hypothetical protein
LPVLFALQPLFVLFRQRQPLPETYVTLTEKITGQRTMTISGLSHIYPVFSQ